MSQGEGHKKATGPRWDQKIDPPNQQKWTIHAQRHPLNPKGRSTRPPKPIQPQQPGQRRHGEAPRHRGKSTHTGEVDRCNHCWIRVYKGKTKCKSTCNLNQYYRPPYHHAEAQEEANQLNVINQSVIGAKEGAAEAITKLVGSNITDAILHTANGSNHKRVNDFTLFDVMQVAINGAGCLSTNDMLEQLIEVINHSLDFCKNISVNMELLQLNTAQMAMYGITIGVPLFVFMLLANIESATKSKYGHKFRLAMHAICKKYSYNHAHKTASLQTILMELAGANRCSCSHWGNGTFHGQLNVIPSRDDGRRGHQLRVHQICVSRVLHQ